MQFTKVHGAGNDFVLIDARQAPHLAYTAMAPLLCHRQTGVGADGLLLVMPSGSADIAMRIINLDGSEADMCGNGIRAFAKYVYTRGIVKTPVFSVETKAGIMYPEILPGEDGNVKVNMGKPLFQSADIPVAGEGTCLHRTLEAAGRTFTFSSVNTGVPHTVVPVDDLDDFELHKYGPAIEHHPFFPARTNVCFYRMLDKQNVQMRVWERGAGPTLACGTGCCATAVVLAKNGLAARSVYVHLALGVLHIEWAQDDTIFMTGPAALVFDGKLTPEMMHILCAAELA